MKYCLNCGRELFDRDNKCDKCNSSNFMSDDECNAIIQEINSANKIKLKFLLKDETYKKIFDLIINKKQDHYINIVSKEKIDNEATEDYFERINKHTINKPQQKCIPKCPTCGSTNVQRIGGIERAASIGMFGIFSRKINKSMKCCNCGYMW